jgi:hypothetical protein
MYQPPTPPTRDTPQNTHLSHQPPHPTAYTNVAPEGAILAPEGAILAVDIYKALCSVHGVSSTTWASFSRRNPAFKQLQPKVKMVIPRTQNEPYQPLNPHPPALTHHHPTHKTTPYTPGGRAQEDRRQDGPTAMGPPAWAGQHAPVPGGGPGLSPLPALVAPFLVRSPSRSPLMQSIHSRKTPLQCCASASVWMDAYGCM